MPAVLSFELSAKQNRIVVNCGLPVAGRDNWRQSARATAAHSTVTFNDTSSCRFIELGRDQAHAQRHAHGRRPAQRCGRARGARRMASCCALPMMAMPSIFNVVHQRDLVLSADGQQARRRGFVHAGAGRDACRRARPVRACASICIPSIKANRLADGHSAMLADAKQGSMDIHRLRGPRRHRGKRLSRRPGRAAPHDPARHLRPRAQRAAGAVDVRTACDTSRRYLRRGGARRGRADEPQLPL